MLYVFSTIDGLEPVIDGGFKAVPGRVSDFLRSKPHALRLDTTTDGQTAAPFPSGPFLAYQDVHRISYFHHRMLHSISDGTCNSTAGSSFQSYRINTPVALPGVPVGSISTST